MHAMEPDPPLGFCLDLTAARAAKWRLPTQWLEVWPAGRPEWRIAWEMSEGMGWAVDPADRLRTTWCLSCEGPTAAERVRAEVDKLLIKARKSLAAYAESIPAKLQDGRLAPAVADQYDFFLKQAIVAVGATHAEVVGDTVCVRTTWDQGVGVSPLARATIESRPAVQSDWFAAARTLDEANHQRLLKGLGGYEKAEGYYPAGAVGGALLRPKRG